MRANDEPVRPIAASCPMDSRLPQPPSGDPAGSPDGQASSHASSNRKAKKAAKKRNRRRQSSSIGEESAFGMDACGSSPGRYSADGGMERGLRLPPIRTLSGESSQTFGRHQGLGTGCGEEGTPMLRRDSGVVPSPRSPALPQRIEEEPFPSFDQYWTGEVKPTQKYPRTDVKWGRTEREKVYNTIYHTPWQLECLVWFGQLLCIDSFLGVFTFLPIRCAKALSRVARSKKLHGDQLFDVICLGIIIMGVWVLRHVRPSWIYFWMKDITAEFMKIHAIYLALEISDKILCNFGVDVLESLSGTCTLFVTGDPRVGLRHLLPDSLLAFVTITMHGLVIMCHGMVWSVAMTSSQNTLVALLIASNFTEIKGTVYKRFDPSKLQDLACQDIVELFHLMLSMLFVAVEDMCNSNTSWPSSEVVKECTRIILAEIVVDIIKHAVLGKFSDVQPGVYREFFKDICDRAMHSQSHNAHRHMGFAPHGAAILAMRIVISVLFMGWQPGKSLPVSSWLARLSALGLAWSALFACKVALGYGIRIVAVGYSNHFNRRFGRPKTPRGIARTGSRAKAD